MIITVPMLRFIHALVLAALGCLLVACGGGGGGGSPAASSQSTVTRMQPGLFANGFNAVPSYPETLAMLTADNRWWAIERQSADRASIFSGTLSQDGLGAGSIATLQGYVGGKVRTGSAVMTSVSEQALAGRISLLADSSVSPNLSSQTLDLAVSKPGASIYTAAAAADVSSLNGEWTGTWIDGANTALPTLYFNSGAVSLASGADVLNCRLTSGSRVSAESGVNLYRIDLAFQGGITKCDSNKTLDVKVFSGVLAIYRLPSGQHRIDFLAVNASGSGIVFRAER
jgi:hypothetical protein